jgi:hypothetical protein
MSELLKIHDEMLKKAEVEQLITNRVSLLEKYAAFATEKLQEAYPNNFTQDAVVELADQMIQHDLAVEEAEVKQAELQEKVAEFDEFGRVMARGYWDELQKLANAETSGK